MTITYVGAGTSATGNNASVTPVAHASTAVGDLVLVGASIRNSGTGTVDTPSGWTRISGSNNFSVFGKIWAAADAIPAITFTGGATNADTIAQTITLRGEELKFNDVIGAASGQLNSSAQDIAIPALDVPGDNHAVVIFLWKQDDVTTIANPTGAFTTAVTTSSTAGDDAGQAIKYSIQTTETDLASGTLTVTGGAAAISRAIVIAVRPAAALAVTEQTSYPPSVLVSLTGLVDGVDTVAIYRSVDGEETLLRGGASAGIVTDPSYLVLDAELPMGVPVSYVAVVNSSVRYTTDPVTYTLPGGKVALSDAISGLSVEAVILAWNELTYDRQSSVFRVGGRNIIVSGDLGQWEADITFYLTSDSANEQFRELLEASTEGVLQIRQPGGYAGVDSYVAVTTAKQARFSQDGSDPRRTWVLHCVQVDGWAPTLEASGATLQDIYDFYGSTGTLADLAGDYATLLALAQVDWP